MNIDSRLNGYLKKLYAISVHDAGFSFEFSMLGVGLLISILLTWISHDPVICWSLKFHLQIANDIFVIIWPVCYINLLLFMIDDLMGYVVEMTSNHIEWRKCMDSLRNYRGSFVFLFPKGGICLVMELDCIFSRNLKNFIYGGLQYLTSELNENCMFTTCITGEYQEEQSQHDREPMTSPH